jgi:calcium-dependent protein kinase
MEEIEKEVDKIFKQADVDGNGEIDYSEWQVATINKYDVLQEEKLRGAFELFDKVSTLEEMYNNLSGRQWDNISG